MIATHKIINAKKTAPSVSILLPTHKSYPHFKLDEKEFNSLIHKAEQQLQEDYPQAVSDTLSKKMRSIVKEINFRHLSESLGIFVSKDTGLILHLPFQVKEKLIIDNSFEIRDLLYAAKHSSDFVILTISHNGNKLYYGYNNILTEIKSDKMPKNESAVEIDHQSKVGNFTTTENINEVNFEKYLRDIDEALTAEEKIFDTPIIIMSVRKTLGLFKKITHNGKKIIAYIEGNYDHSPKEEIYKAIQPALEEKHKQDQDEALNKLNDAINKKKYISGIENVWIAAKEKRGQLLLVEKDYYCTAKIENNRLIVMENEAGNLAPLAKDVVDDSIELVLRSNGDIEFVDNGKLTDHGRIAMVTYY